MTMASFKVEFSRRQALLTIREPHCKAMVTFEGSEDWVTDWKRNGLDFEAEA